MAIFFLALVNIGQLRFCENVEAYDWTLMLKKEVKQTKNCIKSR